MTVPEYLRQLASLEESGGCDLGAETLREIAERWEKMEAALQAVNEVHDDPCRFDHHGLCQAHHLREVDANDDGNWKPECEMQLTRDALAAARAPLGEKG